MLVFADVMPVLLDQADVPESSDWYNAGYIMTWGSNVPKTRMPDAHFLTEARNKGTKVVSVSLDYAESTAVADTWIPLKVGSDSAFAMAMGHGILNEYYWGEPCKFLGDYTRKYTDFPFLVRLVKKENGKYHTDRYLTAADFGREDANSAFKYYVIDEKTGKLVIPNGTIGDRWDRHEKWNLREENADTGEKILPQLSILGCMDEVGELELPYFGNERESRSLTRAVPVKRVKTKEGEILVTTVYDLTLANYSIDRGLGGEAASSYEEDIPYTPKWQEKYTGVSMDTVIHTAREFADNSIKTKGRNGGGWAHYVGQEKLRLAEGWQRIMTGLDWKKPPRLGWLPSYPTFNKSGQQLHDEAAELEQAGGAAEGKLDLLVDIDFRMASSALYADVVLPTATWYEKDDLSSTDMHPFVHPFQAAIDPMWESRTDWDIFRTLAQKVSEVAKEADLKPLKDVVAMPIQHDTKGEIAQPYGKIRDWSKGECEPIPGKTMPNLIETELDYTKLYEKWIALGPGGAKTMGAEAMTWSSEEEYQEIGKRNGLVDNKEYVSYGCPSIIWGWSWHWGGHFVGVLVPKFVTEMGGTDEHTYHLMSLAGGIPAGILFLGGLFAAVEAPLCWQCPPEGQYQPHGLLALLDTLSHLGIGHAGNPVEYSGNL